MASTPTDFLIAPATEHELTSALRIVFRHHVAEEQDTRVRRAIRLIRQGELDPTGVVTARQGKELAGAMVCFPVPGASALVWPPQAVWKAGANNIEDQLLEAGVRWLKARGVKLVQSLLLPEENELAHSLLRHGFVHTTNLRYLRHELKGPEEECPEAYAFQSYADCNPSVFHRTLLETYRDTLDCPEITGVREIDEIMEGHRSQGLYDPKYWWIAFDRQEPAGVLLMTEMPEWNSWDLSYLGIVPAFRRKGIGRQLACHALCEARRAGAGQMTLALDVRNHPASQLYQSLGFSAFEEREVYLAILSVAEGAGRLPSDPTANRPPVQA
jgi:ribosomal protein S18 acetylase RimI-like enzyme